MQGTPTGCPAHIWLHAYSWLWPRSYMYARQGTPKQAALQFLGHTPIPGCVLSPISIRGKARQLAALHPFGHLLLAVA
jgi:hypothetical protein